MSGRKTPVPPALTPAALFEYFEGLINSARQRATAAVNHELSMLYWRIDRHADAKVDAVEA